LLVMEKAGFLDRLGHENVCPNVQAALQRAREILGLPPETPVDPLQEQKARIEAAQQELATALKRTQEILGQKSDRSAGTEKKTEVNPEQTGPPG